MQFKIIKNTPIVSLEVEAIGWFFTEMDFIIDTWFTWACAFYISDDLFNKVNFIWKSKTSSVIMADNTPIETIETKAMIRIGEVSYEIDTTLIEPRSLWWLPLLWIQFLINVDAEMTFDFKRKLFTLQV